MNQVKDWDRERVIKFAQAPKGKGVSPYTTLANRLATYIEQTGDRLTILDIGTGPGRLLMEIKKFTPNSKLIGIDPSTDMIEIARLNIKEAELADIEIVHGSAEEIPVDSKTVDIAVSNWSFLYWDEPEEGLSEIHRVLKPEGKLVISDWNKSYPVWKFYLRNINLLRRAGWWRAQDARRSFRKAYPFDTVLQLVGDASYQVVEAEGKELKFYVMAKKAEEFTE